MFSRLKNLLLFRLEQTMVRGPAARLRLSEDDEIIVLTTYR
jgi:hypothetical protein